MKRWLVFLLPLTMGTVLPLSALADEDDLDWLGGDSAEDEQKEDEAVEEDGDKTEDEFVEEEEEDKDEKKKKKAEVSIGTDEPDENAIHVAAGRMHTFLGVGYSLPLIDLTGDGVGINNNDAAGNVFGGLPIWFGADYFVIDNLPVGLKLRITPLFASGEQDAKATLFDLHAQMGYHFIPGLRVYLGLGYSRLNAKIVAEETVAAEADCFSLGLGLSYTFYLTELGSGGLGLEVGAEYVMMVSPDFVSNPQAGVKGTSADNLFMYPLVLVGLRYSLAL